MKNLMSISCLFLLICIFSCNKDNFRPDYSEGKATAIMNGEEWEGVGRGVLYDHGNSFYLSFTTYNKLGQRREKLSFRKIPVQEGKYVIHGSDGKSQDSLPNCSFYTLIADGDVLDNIYNVVETKSPSSITILTYDESERLLTGEFKVKLYIEMERSDIGDLDSILFQNGKFTVKIEE